MLYAATVAASIVFVSVLGLMLQSVLPEIVAKLALPFHEACLLRAPLSRDNLYRSVVCGERLSQTDLTLQLKTTGLLHLIVVSGSHLRFLERGALLFSRKIPGGLCFVFLLLIGFTLASSAQPPVTRALAAFALQALSTRFRLGLTAIQIVTVSGFFTLMLCGNRVDALSLLLSWTASLAITGFSTPNRPYSTLKERLWLSLRPHLLTHLLMCPLLLPLSVPHPLAIACNWIVAPFLGLVLFPGSLIAFLHPFLATLINPMWTLFTVLISWLAAHIPAGSESIPVPIALLWGYLAALNSLLLFSEARQAAPLQGRSRRNK